MTSSPHTVVDLRPAMPTVRDQGQRPTCLAFAVTAAHEISRTVGASMEDLSAEALYWGCKRSDGNWIGGTSFASASTAIGRWGQPLEVACPYEPLRPIGVAYALPGRAGGKGWYRSGLQHIGTMVSEVRTYLDEGVPVVLGLTLFDSFYHPDLAGRIIDPPVGARALGRHAVLAVGYQAAELLIRNSWGTTWAVGGYAWITDSYLQNHAGDAWVIDADAVVDVAKRRAKAAHIEGSNYGHS